MPHATSWQRTPWLLGVFKDAVAADDSIPGFLLRLASVPDGEAAAAHEFILGLRYDINRKLFIHNRAGKLQSVGQIGLVEIRNDALGIRRIGFLHSFECLL